MTGGGLTIAGWLEGLGLADYAERFAENRIDISVLSELSDQDLKELGVVLGDRRKMLRAIRELVAVEPVEDRPAPEPAPKPDAAERRQLTVMFCDLVGSTAMSARLDPEDMRAIIGAYHKCCASLIERNGGFVAKYMGDGVLAYFGYPQAHEHDAERAVRAGLAIVEAAPKLRNRRRRAAACAGGDRDRDRRRRRSPGFGRGAGARRRRRYAEPRRAAASDRRARQRRHRRGHAQAARQPVRAAGPRRARPQGHRRTGARVGGAAGEFRRKAASRRCTRAA